MGAAAVTRSSAQANRDVAAELLEAGRQWRERQPPSGPPHPEIELQRQIDATKRRGLATGENVKQRLIDLRMRHRDHTGEDGG